jgi:hypothetical protein
MIGTVAVLLAALGKTHYLAWGLVITTPLRVAVWLAQETIRQRQSEGDLVNAPMAYRVTRQALGIEGTIIAIARWSNLWVETRIAQESVTRLWHLLIAFAQWLNLQVEKRIAQEGPIRLWRFFTGTAQVWHRAGEERAVTHIVRGTAQGAISVSQRLQALHTGKLRTNLRWAIAGFMLVVSLLVVTGW